MNPLVLWDEGNRGRSGSEKERRRGADRKRGQEEERGGAAVVIKSKFGGRGIGKRRSHDLDCSVLSMCLYKYI